MAVQKNEYGLTNTEVRFLDRWYLNGFNATQAYKDLYDVVKDSTARTESSLMMDRPHIQDEIARRNAVIAETEKINLAEMISELKQLMTDCKTDKDRKNLIKTIDLLNKMGGFYKTNVDITSKGDKVSINLNLNDTDGE